MDTRTGDYDEDFWVQDRKRNIHWQAHLDQGVLLQQQKEKIVVLFIIRITSVTWMMGRNNCQLMESILIQFHLSNSFTTIKVYTKYFKLPGTLRVICIYSTLKIEKDKIQYTACTTYT